MTAELGAVAEALGSRIVGVRTLAGGFSHRTYLLTLTDGPVVVRVGGAAPDVEAAVMELAGPHVPVPAVLLVEPAVVLEFVSGTLLSDVLDRGPDHAAALGAEVGRVVARIGGITLDRPGFFAGPDLATWPQPPWSEQLAGFGDGCMAKAGDRLDPATRRDWAALCARRAPELTAVDGESRLAHGDVNPKNILVSPAGGGWRVDAVLDWEFAYAGCPAADAANMLRFAGDYPPAYTDGFRAGFGLTPERERLGAVLDMFALSDLVTRPAGNPVADQAAALIRAIVA